MIDREQAIMDIARTFTRQANPNTETLAAARWVFDGPCQRLIELAKIDARLTLAHDLHRAVNDALGKAS